MTEPRPTTWKVGKHVTITERDKSDKPFEVSIYLNAGCVRSGGGNEYIRKSVHVSTFDSAQEIASKWNKAAGRHQKALRDLGLIR